MRLLFSTSRPAHFTEVSLADEQILCGPLQIGRAFEGRTYSVYTGVNDYDLSTVVQALPADQKPQLIACYVDGQTNAFARNLPKNFGPRVLLVGNLMHSGEGLSRVLAYVQTEAFDRVVLVEDCVDEPLFRAAGVQSLLWCPGLLSSVDHAALPYARSAARLNRVVVPKGDWQRYSAVNLSTAALRKRNLSLVTLGDERDFALETLGHNGVAVVFSEMGEVPTDFFTALAAGAAVVTSASPAAGRLNNLLAENGVLLTCRTFDEAATLATNLLSEPEAQAALSARAMEWYDSHLGRQVRKDIFANIALNGRAPGEFALIEKPSAISFDELNAALRYFPALLDCARNASTPLAFVDRSAPAALSTLIERLPRFSIQHGTTPPMGFVASTEIPGLIFNAQFRAALDLEKDARAKIETADFDKAQIAAEQLMSKFPTSPEGYLIAADLAVEKHDETSFTKYATALQKIDPNDSRLASLVLRKALKRSEVAARQLNGTWQKIYARQFDHAEKYVEFMLDRAITTQADVIAQVCMIGLWLKQLGGKTQEKSDLWREAVQHTPNNAAGWFDLGIHLWNTGQREDGLQAFRRAAEQSPHEPEFTRAFQIARYYLPEVPLPGLERDLLITGAESNQKHGAGVLLRRFFEDSREMITLRMGTCFRGVEQVGGINLVSTPLPDNEAQVANRLRRLFAPFKIRRIVVVPFERAEFIHAFAAKSVTGAPLCTYVMDDRNVYTPMVEDALVRRLFDASEFKLTISPEMQLTYGFKFGTNFDLLPPVVTNASLLRKNAWAPKKRPANHCTFVGNVWSQSQYNQLTTFFARTGLKADWFGKDGTAEFERAGIFGQGFLAEPELADRLTTYPFVVVPSGELNGTEENEWLTRLSLPSRIVFLLQCGIPILVLGSPDTCAGRFVNKLDIGRVVSANHPNPHRIVQELTAPESRARILANISAAAEAFIMPATGAWIWNSLEKRMALPAPFHPFLPAQTQLETLWSAA
ncbi:MAG TPA: hypothetical protein VFT72_18255 [Opitutaceae bacterium]|nr:hypothetical protein [Opitutaceae bacterium]